MKSLGQIAYEAERRTWWLSWTLLNLKTKRKFCRIARAVEREVLKRLPSSVTVTGSKAVKVICIGGGGGGGGGRKFKRKAKR